MHRPLPKCAPNGDDACRGLCSLPCRLFLLDWRCEADAVQPRQLPGPQRAAVVQQLQSRLLSSHSGCDCLHRLPARQLGSGGSQRRRSLRRGTIWQRHWAAEGKRLQARQSRVVRADRLSSSRENRCWASNPGTSTATYLTRSGHGSLNLEYQ